MKKQKIEYEKEQNKKMKLRICYNSKCSNICFICKGEAGALSKTLYCHKKCWDLNNCFVCGGNARTECNRNLCFDCKRYRFNSDEYCAVCKKKF